jgi:hypothetical protein
VGDFPKPGDPVRVELEISTFEPKGIYRGDEGSFHLIEIDGVVERFSDTFSNPRKIDQNREEFLTEIIEKNNEVLKSMAETGD